MYFYAIVIARNPEIPIDPKFQVRGERQTKKKKQLLLRRNHTSIDGIRRELRIIDRENGTLAAHERHNKSDTTQRGRHLPTAWERQQQIVDTKNKIAFEVIEHTSFASRPNGSHVYPYPSLQQ